ncbi:MAG TPA: hypothetical protein VGR89_12175 [Puia sp.]|nr:hypothetical protein [Puia sp.]
MLAETTRHPAYAEMKVLTGNPRVAIVMPYDPKMSPGRVCEARQKMLLGKLERDLMNRYSSDLALPVIRKIQQAFKGLNGATHKSSVAIFAEGGNVNVLYMDIPVKETVVVDRSFAVKDILNCRLDGKEYLVMTLTARQSRVFLGLGGEYRIIKSNSPQNVFAYLNEVPTRTGNFSDPADRRQVMLDKFLRHMDEGLAAILQAYPAPVFVVGDPRVTGHFGKLTRHSKNIVAYVHYDSANDDEARWKEAICPYLADWEKLRRQHTLQLVEKAVDSGRLATGIGEVSRQARAHNSRLLVVEEGYSGTDSSPVKGFYVTDAVDQAIWQVLANGGKVEWVDKGALGAMGHIALVGLY